MKNAPGSKEYSDSYRLHQAPDGNLYLIRDVWINRAVVLVVTRQFVRCEYAVRDEDGTLHWKPCAEGAEFAAIEPVFELSDGPAPEGNYSDVMSLVAPASSPLMDVLAVAQPTVGGKPVEGPLTFGGFGHGEFTFTPGISPKA